MKIPQESARATVRFGDTIATVRAAGGLLSREVHVHLAASCAEAVSLDEETRLVYRALAAVLERVEASPEHVVSEFVFLRSAEDAERFLRVRENALGPRGADTFRPATALIAQPPLRGGRRVEVLLRAFVPYPGTAFAFRSPQALPGCACGSCSGPSVREARLGDIHHVFAAGVTGDPEGVAVEEAASMFRRAEEVLRSCGLDFRSVVRTWIYLADMEGDYGGLNAARRAFFERAGVEIYPASTGIGGTPPWPPHRMVMAFHAVQAPGLKPRSMSTRLMNEAPEYGSCFSRGLKVRDGDRVTLYISGTASVDERGKTAHTGHLAAQVDRMLYNVSTLLEGEGASFAEAVNGVLYVKRLEDAGEVLSILRNWRVGGFPLAAVQAEVCRPELLCEMELTVLPRLPA